MPDPAEKVAEERFEAWWTRRWRGANKLIRQAAEQNKDRYMFGYLAADKETEQRVWEFAAEFMRQYPQTHDSKLSEKLMAIAEHFDSKAQEVANVPTKNT